MNVQKPRDFFKYFDSWTKPCEFLPSLGDSRKHHEVVGTVVSHIPPGGATYCSSRHASCRHQGKDSFHCKS